MAQIITSGNRQSAGASVEDTAKIIRPTETAYAEPIRKLGICAPEVRLWGVTRASPSLPEASRKPFRADLPKIA